VKPGALVTYPRANGGAIDFERILRPKPGDWLTYNGNLNANRYSDLSQINTANANKLALKWIFTVPLWKNLLPDTAYFTENMKYFGLEVTPLVADGVMYITGPHSAFALDAQTGREIWNYSRPRTPGMVGDASLGTNRGLAIFGDKVFMVTDNAHLIALNRISGKLVWEQNMVDEPQHYGSTVAPLVVKDMVIAGVAGADWGVRGFLSAYKADTGERAWRYFTIPAKGEQGIETWQGSEPKEGGGSTWITGSYDGETNTLYWPTATPYPGTNDSDRPGDNLYTECILALNPDTGKLKWYYQFTPHDVHVWDATEPPVLVDARYRGQERKLLMMANRNGFFYVLDRINGKVLLARPFINRLTWASGVDTDGRPQLIPEGEVSCPEAAANWNATAFSPKTHLFYTVALEKCVAKVTSDNRKTEHETPGKKHIRALDIETGEVVWERPQIGNVEGKRDAGLLATAGGLIFYGDPAGDFEAMDERNGKPLWHFVTNGENKASPMTYMVGGKQFVAIAIGSNILCFGLPTRSEAK
jgi:PQQ-dependent dehydrogenase (methanol/ethanol family)